MDRNYLLACTRYIEQNPVKASLVKKPENWPWSSAIPHIRGKNDIFVKTEPLSRMVQKKWSESLSEYPDSTDIVTCGDTNEPDVRQVRNISLKNLKPF